MQRGHLVVFDGKGYQAIVGFEATGDVLPHELPKGELNVIELPYGALDGVKRWHMDGAIFVVDELHEREATKEDLLSEIDSLKMALLESEGVL